MLYDVWVSGVHVGRVRCNVFVTHDDNDVAIDGGSCILRDPNVHSILVMELLSEEPQENGLVKRVYRIVE